MHGRFWRRRLIAWLPLLALPIVAACGSARPAAPSPEAIETAESLSSTVSIAAPLSSTPEKGDDDETPIVLSGRVFGRGPTGVILAHSRPADQTAWFPFATQLANTSLYTVLTFNFRGYEGSTGEKQFDRVDLDLTSAYDYMRDQLHISKIILVGASMGATASLAVATEQRVAAVVAISTLAQFPPLDALMSAEQLDDIPKLFVTSQDDVPQEKTQEQLWAAAPEPKEMKVYDGDAHGTDLFEGPHADDLSATLIDFLARH